MAINCQTLTVPILLALTISFLAIHAWAECIRTCNDRGTCNVNTGFCDCYDPYTGPDCQDCKIKSDTGKDVELKCHHGHCEPKDANPGEYECICDFGYDKPECAIRDACKLDKDGKPYPKETNGTPCHNNGNCTSQVEEKIPTFNCSCPEGYLPPQCKYKDPCYIPEGGTHPCTHADRGTCYVIYDENGLPSKNCSCLSDFHGEIHFGRSCEFTDPCYNESKCGPYSYCDAVIRNGKLEESCDCFGPQFAGENCTFYDTCLALKFPECNDNETVPRNPYFPGDNATGVPYCFPCDHDVECTHYNHSDPFGFKCGCKEHHGEDCEFRNPRAVLFLEGTNTTAYVNYTRVNILAGKEYAYYIIIFQPDDSATSLYYLNTGDGAPAITLTKSNFRPIKLLRDENVKRLAEELKEENEIVYFIPYPWIYMEGYYTFEFSYRFYLEDFGNEVFFKSSNLHLRARLAPDLKCLPNTRLSDVSTDLANPVEYLRTTHFVVSAALDYDCFGPEWLEQQLTTQDRNKFHFKWTLYKLSPVFPVPGPGNILNLEKLVNTTNEKHIDFLPHVLLEGLYWISCTAYVKHNGTDYGHSDLGFFGIINDPPAINLKEGIEETVDGDKDIILDASGSFDESFPEDTLYLVFIWECLSPPSCKNNVWEGPQITIPGGTFSSGSTIEIYLRVQSPHATNEAALNIIRHIRSKVWSSLECVQNCFNHNPGEIVTFECNYFVDGKPGPSENITWDWEPKNTSDNLDLVEFNNMVQLRLPHVKDAYPRFLVCIATPPPHPRMGIIEPIISKYEILINQPPVQGNCTVEPPEGMYLNTSFTITCTPFQTVYLPIVYSFYIDVEGAGQAVANLKNLILYGHDADAEISGVYLPYGNHNENFKLDIKVVATDDNGLSSDVIVSAVVERPDEAEIEDLFEDLVFKNDSLMRKRFHSGDYQGAFQLQLLTLMRIQDPIYPSHWQDEKKTHLLTIIARDLQSNPPTTFKDMEQMVNSMHLLEQIEVRQEKEVFQNVSEIMMDNTEKLTTDVRNPLENTPANVKDTIAHTTADSGSRILASGSKFGDEAKGNQPVLTTANLREVTDFVAEERGDHFAEQNIDTTTYDRNNYGEVAESAEIDVQDYCNVAKFALGALEQSADSGADGLAYSETFQKVTKEASIYAEILAGSEAEDGVNVTLSTLRDDHDTEDMTVRVNIPRGILVTAEDSKEGVDLELHIIETLRNPHCDDTSANPNTPFVEVGLKDPLSHVQVSLVNTDQSLEISLPFNRQMSQAEIDMGRTVDITAKIIPPEDLDEFNSIAESLLVFKLNLPYNANITLMISDISSPSMVLKVLPMKDRKPHLRDFCELGPSELSKKNGYTVEFESEKVELHNLEQQEEPYLEYYVGILAFDHKNPHTSQNFSMVFIRPTCLSRNHNIKVWSEKGCFVKDKQQTERLGSRSKLERITCQCNHFSLFAGSHFVIPHTIEDKNPFTDFSLDDFEENPIVIITVSVLVCAFIISFFVCRYLDQRDERQSRGLTIMANLKESSFERYYLITVLTGANLWSGTTSCVCMIMYGSNGKSQIYTLKDRDLTVFRRGAIDTFLVPCDKDIGSLEKIRLWTDHSGYDPAWYCRKILIRHIATNQEWNFYINRWLTVTPEESTVILEVPATDKLEQKRFYVRFKDNLLEQIDSAMLWVSIFRFSPNSTFTRCQRLSSAFAVLVSYLMLDIMAVGTVTEDENGLFDFGEYTIDLYAMMKSIQLVLMALPFGTIIIALFRNIIPRNTPTLIIWKNVIPAKTELKNLFIPTEHGHSKNLTFGRRKSNNQNDYDESGEEDYDVSHNPKYNNNNLQPWNEPQSAMKNSDNVSISSSSTFSIPSTDIPLLEELVAQRLHQPDSGLESDDNEYEMAEEDRFIFNLDEGGSYNKNHLSKNLERLGRRAMTSAVRHFDQHSFVFKGEIDIPELEELVDKRIMEGTRAKKDKVEKEVLADETEADVADVKPDISIEIEPVEKESRWASLFKKVGQKKTPWKELVTNDYLGKIEDSLEIEIENREFAQDKKNWETQIALELCLLPKQKTARCSWPWWFIFIAWFVCTAAIIGSVAFTVLFGAHFGYLRSMKWLENFVGSLFTSNLVVQPLNTLAVAFLVTLFGKKHKLQEMLQVVIPDDKSKFVESRKPYNYSVFTAFRTYGPLLGNQLFRLKIEARRRRELRSKLFRLVLSLLLLVPLIAFSYSGHSFYNYGVTRNIRNMFKLNNLGEGQAHIFKKKEVYDYLENVMLNAIHPATDFNDQPIKHSIGLLSDQQSVLIGVGRIRQQRVKPSACAMQQDKTSLNNHCISHRSYKASTQDREDYNQEWVKVKPNVTRNVPSLDNDGWVFHAADSAKTHSITFNGRLGKYDGGGYIMNLTRNRRGTHNILKHMKTVKWLDHRTRAIFLEFTLMNPSINKFVDVVILIEQGATWTFFIKSWITPVELIPFDELSEKSDEIAWLSVSTVVIVIVIIIMICQLFHDIFTTGRSSGIWLDFSIIVLTFVSLGLSVQRFFAAKEVMNEVDTQELDAYVSIQRAAYWDHVQRIMFSFAQALVYIKTWKLLMFTDKRFLSFALTIRLTFPYMVAFIVLISILITAFAFSGFFLFGNDIYEFSTWGESMITLVDQIIHFEFMEQFTNTNSRSSVVLGMVFCSAYGVFIIFICFNFIVALLDIGFHEAKAVVEQRRVWLTFAQYFKTVLYRTFPNLDSKYKKRVADSRIKLLPPDKLYAMKQSTINYLRQFLRDSGHYKMKEMEKHCNKVLAGSGYRVVSKKRKVDNGMAETNSHIEELRKIATKLFKDRLGHDMKPDEFKEYADFNKAIVKLRIQKMESKFQQLEQQVDEFLSLNP